MRDLVLAQRIAAEAQIDHASTIGGARYVLHGSGGRSAVRLSGGIIDIIRTRFPHLELGGPVTMTPAGEPVTAEQRHIMRNTKAERILGMKFRSLEDSVVDTVESSIALGIAAPVLRAGL